MRMLQVIQEIAAVTDIDDEVKIPKESNPAAYIADLEFRLQQANSACSKLLRILDKVSAPDEEELENVVNALESSLRSLSDNDASIYLSTFKPSYFTSSHLHPDLNRAIKRTLVKFCSERSLPILYKIWSADV